VPLPGDRQGDLYVVVKIEVPKTLDDESRQLLEQLAEKLDHQPRKHFET
jgi:DnaJ-class molecular chaperone